MPKEGYGMEGSVKTEGNPGQPEEEVPDPNVDINVGGSDLGLAVGDPLSPGPAGPWTSGRNSRSRSGVALWDESSWIKNASELACVSWAAYITHQQEGYNNVGLH